MLDRSVALTVAELVELRFERVVVFVAGVGFGRGFELQFGQVVAAVAVADKCFVDRCFVQLVLES